MKRIVAALIFALSLGGLVALPTQVLADVSVSVNIGPPASAGLPPARHPRTGVPLDARLLGLWSRRLLLGTRHLGVATPTRRLVDTWFLGV